MAVQPHAICRMMSSPQVPLVYAWRHLPSLVQTFACRLELQPVLCCMSALLMWLRAAALKLSGNHSGDTLGPRTRIFVLVLSCPNELLPLRCCQLQVFFAVSYANKHDMAVCHLFGSRIPTAKLNFFTTANFEPWEPQL